MKSLIPVNFVNFAGDPVLVDSKEKPKKPKQNTGSYHKGFKVKGYPPGLIEQERRLFEAEQEKEDAPRLWSFVEWAGRNAKKAVRSKPYFLLESANECKELALRAGWEFVEVAEVKKLSAP